MSEERLVLNGTTYDEGTLPEVAEVLERCRADGTRIVLNYGDLGTGLDWGDTCGTTGRVGRSMGPVKVVLLLPNARSIGGYCILTACIVRMREARGKRVLWQHPKFHEV